MMCCKQNDERLVTSKTMLKQQAERIPNNNVNEASTELIMIMIIRINNVNKK